ncbi:short chain dehydrogenase family protein [Aspergillus arachidicola]|uniref:Short chain dehydrogenase family protein n=1 Tax=Aspergillus arachidicola TaxID=656916 RepID=A0A2G7G9U7_9EURO|nr:short chain dehydrogenase family protein [Aspergillus arachidicola]
MIVALVTGGNSGIGEAVARQLARQPDHHVILTARNLEAGREVAAAIVEEGNSASAVRLDLTSDESISMVAKHIKEVYGKLDILVNNAGTHIDDRSNLSVRENLGMTFDTNVFGTAVLTDALLDLLRQSSAPRAVFVSSALGSLNLSNDETWPHRDTGSRAYKSSKAALNMLVLHYSSALRDARGLVNSVCPGKVKTKMNGYEEGGVTPDVGARRIVELALVGEDGPTATFSDRDGPIPW